MCKIHEEECHTSKNLLCEAHTGNLQTQLLPNQFIPRKGNRVPGKTGRGRKDWLLSCFLFTIFSSCKLICQSLFIPNMKISLLWQRFNQFEGFSPPPTQHWNNLLYCVYTKILVPDSLTPHLGIGPFSSVPPLNLETTLPWAEAVTEAQKPQYWLSLSIQGTGFQLCKPLL